MPFTPFHMGPGAAIKAVAGKRFSLLVFGASQVAMDIEPLIGMLRGWPELHAHTHTFLMAALIAIATAAVAPALLAPLIRRLNWELEHYGAQALSLPERIGFKVALTSAAIGTFSHVAIDGFMHSDLSPFAPFAQGNPWLWGISLDAVHYGSVALGIVGLAVLSVQGWSRLRSVRRAAVASQIGILPE